MKTLVPLLLFLPLSMLAQTTTENYIKSTTYKVPTKTGNVAADQQQENITYYDGLGRPIQQVAVRQSTSKNDIITHIEYDHLGRQAKSFLPYASSHYGGSYRTNALAKTNSFYNTKKFQNTTNPYNETFFEKSPLNLPIEIAAPGNDWKEGNVDEHTIKKEYRLVENSDQVYNFRVSLSSNGTPSLVNKGVFEIGLQELQRDQSTFKAPTLYKFITKNENWKTSDKNDNTTQIYKDYRGRTILKRTFDKNIPHDTYYVYDDYGNLSYVLPPLASEKTIVYQTGMKSYSASKFVTGGNATGTIKFGIQKTAPGKYTYVADFDLHNLANSSFKSAT